MKLLSPPFPSPILHVPLASRRHTRRRHPLPRTRNRGRDRVIRRDLDIIIAAPPIPRRRAARHQVSAGASSFAAVRAQLRERVLGGEGLVVGGDEAAAQRAQEGPEVGGARGRDARELHELHAEVEREPPQREVVLEEAREVDELADRAGDRPVFSCVS